MRDERGVTLIEVLAALTILSIIGVTIWQTFFQGLQYSQKSVTKNMLQQESNIVISTLTRIHQTIDKYTIKSASCEITILDKNNAEIQKFSNSQYCFKIENPDTNAELPSTTLEPIKTGNDFPMVVRISDEDNSSNYVAVKTLLYRLKEGEKYE